MKNNQLFKLVKDFVMKTAGYLEKIDLIFLKNNELQKQKQL